MKVLFRILPCVFLLACDELPRQAADASQAVFHPRVIWTEQPAEHAIISWSTAALGAESLVWYDTVASLAGNNSSRASKEGQVTLRPKDVEKGLPTAYYHHAELTNLMPSTRYYFKVCTDGTCSELYNFITAPADGRAFSILSGGDSRLRSEDDVYAGDEPHTDRQAMNRSIRTLVEQHPDVLALAHGADYCMNADWRYLYWWFEDQMLTITADKRILPLIVSRGNHDHQIGFVEHFWLGEISDNNSEGYYYYTRLSPAVGLITLNTETSMAGYQLKWLKKTLPQARAAHDWLLAQYHKPAYPAVKPMEREDFTRVRMHWVPLFEKNQLDVALESDGHALKRTVPIRNNAYSADGVVYVGEGGLGVPQRKVDASRWYFQEGGVAMSEHHLWKLDVSGDKLHVTALGMQLDTLDYMVMNQRK